MNVEEEIDVCLRSRFTLICIVTPEEEHVIGQIRRLCERTNRTLDLWDHADYFQRLVGPEGALPQCKDPISALEAIDKMDGSVVAILRDFHQCWEGQPRVVRKLRNLAQGLKYTRKTIIVTMPNSRVPEELRDNAVVLECSPPGVAELKATLEHLAKAPGVRVALDDGEVEKLVTAALGLSANQAQRVFSRAIVSHGLLDERDIARIMAEKKQIIRESGALEYYEPTETVSDVGGLQALKEWLRMRKQAFSREAGEYGLPAPKGIALIGIPGTGKSLTAKTISALWNLPLIRLDIGALFGSLVGQSEENTRRALRLAETIAPCLLWIDELEKGLAVGGGDGGTSMRVFGTLLSWMQEKQKPVFVVATANNIALLPPELLRRGRFDEVFFLDLPTKVERAEIFQVHLRKRKRQPEKFDIDRLADAAEGYVGAEIEQGIIDAMFDAFSDQERPRREFTTEDVLQALKKLIPMSRSQREIIGELRQWMLEGRAQSASFREPLEARERFVSLQLEPQANAGTGR